jgi:hypothetical protein
LQQSDGVAWAMELPDVNEPRNNVVARDFMRTFYRGNRDTAQRMSSGSILQQLSLMNGTFILDRLRLTGTSPSPLLSAIAKLQDNSEVIEEIFLTFLSRKPTALELARAEVFMRRTVSRTVAIQDLAWVCINKVDFLFSY